MAAEWSELTRVQVDVRPVVNTTLGESITVAGLLMGKDVIEQLQSQDLGQQVVLPAVMFRGPNGVSLDDLTPEAIGSALNSTVILGNSMSDLGYNGYRE